MTEENTLVPMIADARMSRRAALRSMGAAVLLLGSRELAFGASIVAVRVWPAADYTRITIESDSALSAKHFIAENPSRLVIDVDVPEGMGSEEAVARIRDLVSALDQYHRSLGHAGLELESAEATVTAPVAAEVPA